jgi:hypothetical protein
MTAQCIHGFPTQHCNACRTCPHDQVTSTCARCRAEAAVRRRSQPEVEHAPQEHAGYEIFYEPAVSGWRFRGTDEAASQLSYRSAFLARKAVDGLASGGPATAAAGSGKRSKKR